MLRSKEHKIMEQYSPESLLKLLNENNDETFQEALDVW